MRTVFLFFLVGLSAKVCAQCGYPVTLRTNRDYCVGSSITANSSHAMQRIVWFRNGQPVSTATGVQSLSTQYVQISVVQNVTAESLLGDIRIRTDDFGNIYILYDSRDLLKTNLQGESRQIVGFTDYLDGGGITGIDTNPAGDVYVAPGTDKFSTGDTALVWKVPAGTLSAQSTDLPVVMPLSAIPNDAYPASAIYVDCHHTIYLYNPSVGQLYRYTIGAVAATLVGNGLGTWAGCDTYNYYGEIQGDAAGNIFYLEGSYVKEIVPGAGSPQIAVPGSCTRDDARLVSDFCIDGQDTIYLTVFNSMTNIGFVEKWAPGASTGQQLFSFPLQKYDVGIIPITMDSRGNIFVGHNVEPANDQDPLPNVYEYKRTTSIDSAFTPTDTGAYYAVVTDIRGYTTTSDTLHINLPSPGPPSIQVTATATSTPVCTPITFTAQTTNPGSAPSFQWQVSGVPVGGDSASYSYNLFANGDQVYCILTAQAGCAGPIQDTSNIITLNIDAQGAAAVTISTPKDSICQGDTAIFTATVAGGSNQPVFEWLVNGDSTGDVSASFNGSQLPSGDVVTCLITSDDACGLAKSNSIPLTVSIPPGVAAGQIFTVLHGHSVTLEPVTSGDIDSWRWTPGTGLSDTSIADPVADPDANTLYTLTVSAPGGCSATGTILVNVYTPLSIPGAFTPNGDGHNDDFYVLGGPVNSLVEDFAVFNRFGAELFHAHDVAPGDKTHAWDGRFHGSPAPAGTYVYIVVMKLASGSRQVYKGTVVLVR